MLYNFVFYKGKVMQIQTNYELFKACIDCDRGINIEPIPLTEEWLLKFGFEKIDFKHIDGSISKGVFKNYPCVVESNKLDEGDTPYIFSRIVPSEPRKMNYFNSIKYVHQLQNLYHALTGQELKTK